MIRTAKAGVGIGRTTRTTGRFAAAVTGHHARLGTRLLARLCRGRHLRRLNSMRLQGATLTEPDVQTRRKYCFVFVSRMIAMVEEDAFVATFSPDASSAKLATRPTFGDTQRSWQVCVRDTGNPLPQRLVKLALAVSSARASEESRAA